MAQAPSPDTAVPPAAVPESWAARTFSALRDPHFRMLYLGNVMQFCSMQMQQVVRGWLVFQLTGSFAALGTMALANAIPGLILSPVGGVIADRATKKTVIQVAQIYNMINAAVILVLVAGWFGLHLQFWHLFVGAFLQGGANSIMQPSRQAMISDLVPEHRLMNAIGINSSGQTMMQLMAPGIAGFLIAWASPAVVYGVMTTLYFLAVVFTMRLPREPLHTAPPRANARPRRRGIASVADLFDGLRYCFTQPTIRLVLSVNFFIVILAFPYQQMLPGFVAAVLHKGAFEQGVLQSIQGVGALIGSLMIAGAASRGRGKMLLIAGTSIGVGLVGFSLSTNFWITLPIMVFIGAGQAARMAIGQTLVQTYSEPEYRGRVMAVWFMQFSLVQFGTFIVGMLAEAFGPQIAIGGLAVLLVVVLTLIIAFVRPIRALQ